MNEYFESLCEAMALLAKDPKTVFMGQACRYLGTAMFSTLRDVPMEQRLELPVAENMQLGMATGIALAGGLPVCMYPRINFMLEALPQLVQHLDKIPLFSDYRPKVIIRTSIATTDPLDPGVQHIGDYSSAIESMLSTVKVVRLTEASMIVPAYKEAIEADGSTLIVEWVQKYHL
jgi:pyruvate/2-oxoglutarate/acetoin dehydrogenase E1 component